MSNNKFNKLVLAFILCFTSLINFTSCSLFEPQEHTIEQLCAYCNKCIDSNCKCEDKCSCEPLEITKEVFTMYEDSIWETSGYLFKTNKEGPGIVIIGGIHGDEIAGWTAASNLIDLIENERKVCGNILIVPKVNILADQRQERFVGKTPGDDNRITKTVTIDGITESYSDLNRSFETGRYDNATSRTIWLSDQIVSLVSDFNEQYGADYIIDLHESKSSWVDDNSGDNSSLGDTLIYSNKGLLMRKIISNYNKNYRLENENEFGSDVAEQNGSFSMNMSLSYPTSVVFTIETNRNFKYTSKSSGYDQIDLDVRVRQQLNMLRSMFDIAWERI